MTIQEYVNHYKNGYRFEKETGMSASSFMNWVRVGKIPIASQMKIEELSGGALRARLEDAK